MRNLTLMLDKVYSVDIWIHFMETWFNLQEIFLKC